MKQKILNFIHWILLFPIILICLIIGYALGCHIDMYLDKILTYYKPVSGLIIVIVPGIFAICGARIFMQKHKALVTSIAIISWMLFMGFLASVTYMQRLDLYGY